MIEVPDEISLIFGISNCPFRCEFCHTPQLQEDVGEDIYYTLDKQISQNIGGITCVCLLGGDADLESCIEVAKLVRGYGLKTAIYLGASSVPTQLIPHFDYIKVGQYVHSLGGLDSPSTNQRFYRVIDNDLVDITFKFIKNRC